VTGSPVTPVAPGAHPVALTDARPGGSVGTGHGDRAHPAGPETRGPDPREDTAGEEPSARPGEAPRERCGHAGGLPEGWGE
jgi:hypothetical protein